MDIKTLKNFVKIADLGSISKAAKELHLSQPPLTKQMQALEASLGVRLFDRSAKGVELTDEGKLLYSHAVSMIAYDELVIKEIANCSGIIRYGATTSSVEHSLSLVKEFNADNSYQFEITEGNTFNLLDLLSNNLIDLAFVRTPFKINASLNHTKLTTDCLVVAGSPSFLEPYNDTILTHQLSNLPLIVIRRWKEHIDYLANLKGISLNYQYICDDNRTALSIANNNMGVAILPSSTIDKRLSRRQIVDKSIGDSSFDTSIFLVYPSHKKFNRPTFEFINFVLSKAFSV